jgi:predicted nucleic acid-binding protein
MAKSEPDPYLGPVLVLSVAPATYLTELGYARRLVLLNQIAVPETVLSHLARTRPELAAKLRATTRVVVAEPQPTFIDQVRRAGIRDEAAAAAIGLALESHGVAVVDDSGGQRAASSLGLPLANSLGLLDQLHRVGLAARPLRQDVLLMGQHGFAIPPPVLTALRSGDPGWLRQAVAAEALTLDWVGPAPPSAGPEVEELQR